MKNILYISHDMTLTGAPISLFLLIKGLDRDKFNPTLACPVDGPLREELDKVKVDFELIGRDSLSNISITNNILRVIKKKNIDIIHTNTVITTYGAIAGRLAKLPVVWHIREDLSQGLWNKILIKIIGSLADKIIVISKKMGEVFEKSSDKLEVIYNGVDLSRFHLGINGKQLRDELSLDYDIPIVGWIGSMEPRKGCRYFLEAVAKVIKEGIEAKFLMVGDSLPIFAGYKQEMEELAASLGISKEVIFTGWRRDIPQVMAALDLFVMSSLQEPLGRVLIEAMAMRKPTVATRVGGIPEVVEEESQACWFLLRIRALWQKLLYPY